jgi:hypothetical protein
VLSILILALLSLVLFIRFPKYRVLVLIIGLLSARIGFNLFVLPHRYNETWLVKSENSAIEIAEKTKGETLYVLDDPSIYHQEAKLIKDMTLFYLQRARGAVVPLKSKIGNDGYYIVPFDSLVNKRYSLLDTLYIKSSQLYPVVKFEE